MTNSEFQSKLAKICGMLGSAHAGERDAAALKATALLVEMGSTWEKVILGERGYSRDLERDRDLIKLVELRVKHALESSAWERERQAFQKEREAWKKERAALFEKTGQTAPAPAPKSDDGLVADYSDLKPHAARARKLLDEYHPAYINESMARFLRDVAGKLARWNLTQKQEDYLTRIEAQCERMAAMSAKRKAVA